jgi:serine/threonine-protein kinase
MDCGHAERLLQAYIDNECTPEEIDGVEDHLGECEKCRKVLAELRAVNLLAQRAFQEGPDSAAAAAKIIEQLKSAKPPEKVETPAAPAVEEVSATDETKTPLPVVQKEDSAPKPAPEKKVPEESIVGKTVAGYQILQELGRGAMGAVYKAVQISMKRVVAFKILKKDLALDKSFIERFYREARSAGSLTHGNLIRVYDVGESSGVHFISMEFIEGENVQTMLRRDGKIDPLEALEITAETVAALDHAWKNGIIHRDIKPENIMLTRESHVKVADMGLAKRFAGDEQQRSDITLAGQVVGTPYYMSPEQVRGYKDLNHLTDVYSLGAALYAMVTGVKPFTGKSNVEIMAKVLKEDLLFPEESIEELPPEMLEFIEKLMAKDRRERFQTGGEILAAIEHVKKILAGEIASGAGYKQAAQAIRQRHRVAMSVTAGAKSSGKGGSWIWIASGAAAVLLIALVIFLSMPDRKQQQASGETGATAGPSVGVVNPQSPEAPTQRPDRTADTLVEKDESLVAYGELVKIASERPYEYAELQKRYREFLGKYQNAKKDVLDDVKSSLAKVNVRIDELFGESKKKADAALAANNYIGAIEAWKEFRANHPTLKSAEAAREIANAEAAAAKRFDDDIKKAEELLAAGKFDEAAAALAGVSTYGIGNMAAEAQKRIARFNDEKKRFNEEAERKERELAAFDENPRWQEFIVATIASVSEGDVESALKLADSKDWADVAHLIKDDKTDLELLAGLKRAFFEGMQNIAVNEKSKTQSFQLRDGKTASGDLTGDTRNFVLSDGTVLTIGVLHPAEVVRVARPYLPGSDSDKKTAIALWLLHNEETAETERASKAVADAMDELKRDPKNAQAADRFEKKSAFLVGATRAAVADRTASKLYDLAIKDFNSENAKTLAKCLEKLDRLLMEFPSTPTVSKNRDKIESMRVEVASKCKPEEEERVEKGVPKEYAAVFHGRIKKGPSGMFAFSYDWTNPEQLKDWEPGPNFGGAPAALAPSKDSPAPWTIAQEKGKPALFGAGPKAFYFRAPMTGNVIIDVNLTVKEARNLVFNVCDDKGNNYYSMGLWLEPRMLYKAAEWISEFDQATYIKSASIFKSGGQRRGPRVRNLKNMPVKAKTTGKLRITVEKNGNNIILAVNDKQIACSDVGHKNGSVCIGAIGGEVYFESVRVVGTPDANWLKRQYAEAQEREKREEEATKRQEQKADGKAPAGRPNEDKVTKDAREKFGDGLTDEEYGLIDEAVKYAPEGMKNQIRERLQNTPKENVAEIKKAINDYKEMKEKWGGGNPPPQPHPQPPPRPPKH